MASRIHISDIARRFWWDLRDAHERIWLGYWLIWQLPGLAGNLIRTRYLARYMKRIGSNVQVMAGCRFRSIENLELGDNVNIGFDCFLQAIGGLVLGDNVSLAPGVKIWTTNHNIDDPSTPIRDQGQQNHAVVVGDDVYIASNVFILPGANIGEGTVISPGAVVGGKNYPPYAILAGNPAKVVGYRGGQGHAIGATAPSARPRGVSADMRTLAERTLGL